MSWYSEFFDDELAFKCFRDEKTCLRINPFVAAKSTIVGDLFGEHAAQFDQQLGLEHPISVDLALDLKRMS